MISHIPSFVVRPAAVVIFVLALAAPASSQVESGFAKEGGFVGVSFLPDFTFDGVTFDGETFYQEIDGEEIVILPRLDVRDLVRVTLGYRARQASIEVSYDHTRHNGTFLDLPGRATFQAINVDGRLFFAPRSRLQPHLLLGGTFPAFRVKDGSFLDPAVSDARFKGYGLNTEAGVTVYTHHRVGISVGYNYRVLWFDRVKGVSSQLFELRPRFRETSGSLVLAGHFIF